jgi:hypothetical protein
MSYNEAEKNMAVGKIAESVGDQTCILQNASPQYNQPNT